MALAVLAMLLPAKSYATNTLRSHGTVVEAPDGLTFDRMLSTRMDMDVYRNADAGIIFAIGSQPVIDGINAVSVAAAIARSCNGAMYRIDSSGVYVAVDAASRRIYGVRNGKEAMPVVLIVGAMSIDDAIRYLATMR